MPRKRKGGKRRRESSGNRWKRNRATQARYQAFGIESDGPIHRRIELDSLEFLCAFRIVGGLDSIDQDAVIRVYDSDGNRVALTTTATVTEECIEHRMFGAEVGAVVESSAAVVPDILLGIGRDKASLLMRSAADAEARRQILENLRDAKRQAQVSALLVATRRNAFGWYRQEMPDQNLRSILLGSNNGKDPTSESDSLVVCFKTDDGRYHVAEETWDGSWSEPDKDGFRERVGVQISELPITFHDEHEAQRAVVFAAKAGQLERFEDRRDASHMHRIAARLRAWEHEGQDFKKIYG